MLAKKTEVISSGTYFGAASNVPGACAVEARRATCGMCRSGPVGGDYGSHGLETRRALNAVETLEPWEELSNSQPEVQRAEVWF